METTIDMYDQTTRSSGNAIKWENGTKLFLNFSNNGTPITGVAEYDANEDIWILTYSGNLDLANKVEVAVYYFTEYEIDSSGKNILLSHKSAIYSDTNGVYSLLSDGELRIIAHLTPYSGRIRFKGNIDTGIKIDGIVSCNNFNIESQQYTFCQNQIDANVKSDGYTSYIYGKFSETSSIIRIKNAEYSFIRECSENILENGKSGWMNIPSEQNHNGWTFFDIPNLTELGSSHHTLTLNISSSKQWDIELEQSYSWIVIDEKEGVGNKSINIEILDNASMNPRTGVIRVSSELGLTTEFTITQHGRLFEVDVEELIFDYQNQVSDIINVKTDGPFDIICSSEWVNITEKSNNSFKIDVLQNDSKQERYGTVTISLILDNGEYAAKEICVTQAEFGYGYHGANKYVDLGLPSGIKWSAYNVGSNNLTELGNQYAWGETSTKSSYDWTNYKYGWRVEYTDYISMGVTKYEYGGILTNEDDAAYVNLGVDWHTSSPDEWTELYNNCSYSTVTIDNKKVIEFVGPNGACLYLPFNQRSSQITEYWTNQAHYSYNNVTGGNYYRAKDVYIVYYAAYGASLNAKFENGQYRAYGAYIRPVLR